MTAFDLRPDAHSPVPLYHQIAEALRYRIATGAIAAGEVLPPLREAGRSWGVNLHTVRRAYAELAAAGVVETRAPLGTQVLPGTGRPAEPGRSRASRAAAGAQATFLDRVIEDARRRHGLSLAQLLALLESRRGPSARAEATVRVAECSVTQSADLARQIERRWRVRAVPWPIDRPEPDAAEAVVATYFHYNDLRVRWPGRFADIHFLPIRPDSGLPARLVAGTPARHPGPEEDGSASRPAGSRAPARPDRKAVARTDRGRIDVVLCEREEAMLRNIVADVSRLLPADRFRVRPKLVRRPTSILEGAESRSRVLVAPRLWGDLPDVVRDDPRVHELRYVFDPGDLDALGRDLGWSSRREA